ncbi:MAG: RNA polymerase sigma factor [Verrucomicrobiia bacterium]
MNEPSQPVPTRRPATPTHADFPQTEWSLVLEAGRARAGEGSEALERLCRIYWPAIYAFLRHHGHSPPDAQDLTQSFVLNLLRRQSLANAEPAKGRFRSFLLGALKYFLADENRKLHAQKRIESHIAFSLDGVDPEQVVLTLATNATAEDVFDRQWAYSLLDRGVNRLRQEHTAAGKLNEFELLKPLLTTEPSPGEYATLAARLRISSDNVAVRVHRLRQRFRDCVRSDVAKTVSNPNELEQELRDLFSA